MKRRRLFRSFASPKSAARTNTKPPAYFRSVLEPLEDRRLLSAVSWDIDQSLSSLTLAIPDQDVTFNGTTINVKVRNQSGGNSGPWNVGNTAPIDGFISTNYVDDTSIEFLPNQTGIVGVNSGNYRPDPAAYVGGTVNPDGSATGGSFTGSATAPGVFGARIRATVSIITTDAGFASFYNVSYDTSSPVLPISAGSFPTNTTNVGIKHALIALDGISIIIVGQPLEDQIAAIDNALATNSAPTGTVIHTGPLTRRLTTPITLNLTIPVDADPAHDLHATATGTIVANATLTPDVPPVVTAGTSSTWTNAGPVALASSGTVTTTPGGTNITSMTVSLTSPQAGDVLNSAGGGGISVGGNGTSTLTFTGAATDAAYQAVLQAITYDNTNGGPGALTVPATIVATDANSLVSNIANATVNISVAPVVKLDPPNTNYTTTWTNGSPVTIVNSSSASVSDGESGSLTVMTATLTSPQAGDVLTANTSGTSIVASFSLGVLTLTGPDSLANYQQVLRTVQYNNTLNGPGVGSETVDVVANDGTNVSSVAVATINITPPSTIAGRRLFYNQSGTAGPLRYDGNNAAINANDDLAIATDKTAYLPGSGAATFANVSSYTKGINGIMVDIAGAHGTITAADFIFRVGNNNTPNSWVAAPAPSSISVRAGAGTGGSDRVVLTWANSAITKKWLEVIVLAGANTGLAQKAGYPVGQGDVFFFGNALADSGTGDNATQAVVNATDELAARNNPATLSSNIPITNLYDYNRDGQVNTTDALAARNNPTNTGNVTKFLNIANPPTAPEASPASDGGVVASALSAPALPALPTVNLTRWLGRRLDELDLNHGPIARYLQHLHDQNTPQSRRILVEVDRVADRLGLDDSLLDSLLADLGLE